MTWGETINGRAGASLIVVAAFGFALSTPLAPLVYAAGGTPATVMMVRGLLITATIGVLFVGRGWRPPATAKEARRRGHVQLLQAGGWVNGCIVRSANARLGSRSPV